MLRSGRWSEGWAAWPAAIAAEVGALEAGRPGVPRWDGSPLAGRTLAVWPSVGGFGFGDWLLWARYLPRVVGGRVLLVAPPGLHRLLERAVPGALGVRPDAADRADARTLAVELPLLLGLTADAGPGPPYLTADPADVDRWGRLLALVAYRRTDDLVVGLCWQPGRDESRFPLAGRRGVSGRLLPPLLAQPGVRWISLQVGEYARDTTPWRLGVEPVGPRLATYADTAAVAEQLDLVISVDTSVANLVGAMGRPAWVLLPHLHDPRWGLRDTAAVYPSCRLFRQRSPGDWAPVIAEVAAALRELVTRRRVAAQGSRASILTL